MGKSAYDEDNEELVIDGAHTIVEPDAVMVKVGGASVAHFAVLALVGAEAIAVLAVVVIGKVGVEFDIFVVLGPLVQVDHPVSGVEQRAHQCEYHHEHARGREEGQDEVVGVEVMGAGEEHHYLGGDRGIREQLRERGRVGECMGCVPRFGVIGGLLLDIRLCHIVL